MAFTGPTAVIGQAQSIAVTATAKRNATALPAGKYLLRVGSDTGATGLHLRFGASDVTATTSDLLMNPGDYFEFIVPTDPALQFLSLVRNGSTSITVYIAGNDNQTAKSQPPSWS